MNYKNLLDEDVLDFVLATESYYPSGTKALLPDKQREIYNQMCEAFSNGRPKGVTTRDQKIDGIPVRFYTTQTSVDIEGHGSIIIYFHGGGYVVGDLESHDDVCAEICIGTELGVLAVDYRLAPEHKHPAMFDDAFTVLKYITENYPVTVILSGDSAGGNLACSVIHASRPFKPIHNRILGQVLIYPTLDSCPNKGSYIQHQFAPLLTRQDVCHFLNCRIGKKIESNIPNLNPLDDKLFSDIPPTIVYTADLDPLRDDGANYCKAVQKAGGKALWINELGLVHGFLRARHTTKRAKANFQSMLKVFVSLTNKWDQI